MPKLYALELPWRGGFRERNSNVKALVYIAAFVPDVGETQGS